MLRLIAVIALSVALAGCDRLSRDTAECRSLGFQEGTEAMGGCILQLRQTRASRATTSAIFATGFAED